MKCPMARWKLKSGADLFEREVREIGSFPHMLDGDRADVSTAVEVELGVLVQIPRDLHGKDGAQRRIRPSA